MDDDFDISTDNVEFFHDVKCFMFRYVRFVTYTRKRSLTALAQTEAPAPSDHLDVAVIKRRKNDINTVRFLTQTARFVS